MNELERIGYELLEDFLKQANEHMMCFSGGEDIHILVQSAIIEIVREYLEDSKKRNAKND